MSIHFWSFHTTHLDYIYPSPTSPISSLTSTPIQVHVFSPSPAGTASTVCVVWLLLGMGPILEYGGYAKCYPNKENWHSLSWQQSNANSPSDRGRNSCPPPFSCGRIVLSSCGFVHIIQSLWVHLCISVPSPAGCALKSSITSGSNSVSVSSFALLSGPWWAGMISGWALQKSLFLCRLTSCGSLN